MVQFTSFVASLILVHIYGLPLAASLPAFAQQQQPMFNQFGNPIPFRQVAPNAVMSNPYAAPAPIALNAPATAAPPAPPAPYGTASAVAPAAVPPAAYGTAAAAAPAAVPPATYGSAAAVAPAAAYDSTTPYYTYEEEANDTLAEAITPAETAKPDCYYSQGPPSTPATIFRWPTPVQPTFGFPVRDVGAQFMQPAQPMQSFQPMRDVGPQFMQPAQSMQTLQPQSMHTFQPMRDVGAQFVQPVQSMQTLQPMPSMSSMQSMQTLQPMSSMQSMQTLQPMSSMQSMQNLQPAQHMQPQPTFHSVGSPMTATGFGSNPGAPIFTGQREVLNSQFSNPNQVFPANNMAFNGFTNLNHPALNNQGIFNRVN